MKPKLHFSPKKNWINDPLGFCYYKGKYHLYAQYFPYDTKWGTMHWLHLTSDNLVIFEEIGIANYPSTLDDRNGCFTGCAYVNEDKIDFYYTGVNYTTFKKNNIHDKIEDSDFYARQMHVSSQDGYNLDIYNKKVIISEFHSKLHKTHTRDPKVWKHKDDKYMILATKVNNRGAFAFFKEVNNEFVYCSTFEVDKGTMLECPDFFSVNNEHYIIYCLENYNIFNSGYQSNAFISKVSFNYENVALEKVLDTRLLDYGRDIYATQTTIDENGDNIMISWIRMEHPNNEWIGMFTLPRKIISVNGLICTPLHDNIKNEFKIVSSSFDKEVTCLINTGLEKNDFINIGGYEIEYADKLTINRENNLNTNSTLSNLVELDMIGAINLSIVVDRCVIEVYINNGQYVVTHVIDKLNSKIKTNKKYEILIMENDA